MGQKEAKKAFCEWCHSRCRVVVHTEDGRLKEIEEDPSFPLCDNIFPPTRACLRLRGAYEFMYHPDRVNFPLKRREFALETNDLRRGHGVKPRL